MKKGLDDYCRVWVSSYSSIVSSIAHHPRNSTMCFERERSIKVAWNNSIHFSLLKI